MKKASYISLFLSLLFGAHLQAQTCCSGGVPVSSNIGFSHTQKQVLQLSLNTNFNTLKTLYSGNQALDDDDRKRSTQSYLMRAHYTFTDRLAVEGFFPLVRQTREIFSRVNDASDFESSFGVGDPILLASYKIVDNNIKWAIGGGLQFPLGSFTERNSRGLFLVEDLQPGSGALDVIIISLVEIPLAARPSANLFGRTIFDLTGSNPNSRNGRQTYTFGNDYQFIAGISDQLFIAQQVIYPAVSLRYRNTQRDKVDSNENTGTGGNWLFAKASLGINFIAGTKLTIDVELPIYTFVNETQLSPNSILNISIHKAISFSKEPDLFIN